MGKKYQVLARKYRPQKFADVIGQDSVLTTLKNALQFDQAAHAYLFCGSRGVGKTTLARLFAKALNCPHLSPNFEPCNECPSCFEITSGQSLDVMEIDGASNRGIDDIRQINETVGYAPSHGKYKIYIIDEVHMLTKEAFNALLKTLEEPPERAKFFFATTEPHKVLPTIISRCQRFDLLRISTDRIARKLALIAADMSRQVEPEALHLIASFSDGSLRDAESLFDQILCFASSFIGADTVRQVLGLIPQDHFFSLDRAFAECRLSYAFELVEQLFQAGKDLSHFLEQLVEHYRLLCLCKTLGERALPSHLSERYLTQARLYSQPQCLYILDLLIAGEQTLQKSPFPRVAIESLLLHLIRSRNRIPVEVIARRLSELEQALQNGSRLEEPNSKESPSDAPSNSHTSSEKPVESVVVKPPEPEASDDQIIQTTDSIEPPPIQQFSKAPSVFDPVPAPPVDSFPQAPSVFDEPKAPLEPVFELPPAPEPAPPIAAEPVKVSMAPPPEPIPAPVKIMTESGNPLPKKHPSHYDTLMRFAAIELEGTLKT